jgi:hypothetical protein
MIASPPPGLREPSGHILGTSMLLLGQPGKRDSVCPDIADECAPHAGRHFLTAPNGGITLKVQSHVWRQK